MKVAEPYSYCACRLKIAASSVVAQFVQDHIEQVTELNVGNTSLSRIKIMKISNNAKYIHRCVRSQSYEFLA